MGKARMPRKLKKKVIKTFGYGTYQGILEGILKIVKYNKLGVHIIYTKKGLENSGKGSRFYFPHQFHPFITFKNFEINEQTR